MAKPPRLAKPVVPGSRNLYTPIYLRRHDEDAFEHCIITLDQCGHVFMAEHDDTQLRFRLPVREDGTCPTCGSQIGGQFTWQFYTDGALDKHHVERIPNADKAREQAAQTSQPKNPRP